MPKTMESPSPATQKSLAANGHPTQEQIALRAYQLFLERDGTPGNELQDWLQAENQLAGENGRSRKKTTVKSATA